VGRILLSIVLGLFAPVVAFMAAAMVEVPGQNPIQEPVAAGIAVAIYLAICQFLVTPREKRTLSANWATMIAMGASLAAVCLFALAKGRGVPELLHEALPPIVAGCLGIVAGAIVAARVTPSASSLGSCRRALWACVALLVGVAFVVAAGVIPAVKADRSPQAAPESAARGSWVIVVVAVILAASLALIAARAGQGRRPSFIVLGFLAFVAFVLACSLAPSAALFTHSPPAWTAGVLGVLCSASAFVVAALVGTTALRLPDEELA